MKAIVFETTEGLLRCDHCGKIVECNENGDMPEVCQGCGDELDYSAIVASEEA